MEVERGVEDGATVGESLTGEAAGDGGPSGITEAVDPGSSGDSLTGTAVAVTDGVDTEGCAVGVLGV